MVLEAVIVAYLTAAGVQIGPNAAWDAIKFAGQKVLGGSEKNHDLARAFVAARKPTTDELEKWHLKLGKTDHVAAQMEIGRWCADNLNANHPAIAELVIAYLRHDADAFTQIVADFVPRQPSVPQDIWDQSIGLFAASWMFMIGVVLKQPDQERAFKAFTRESLFQMGDDVRELLATRQGMVDEIVARVTAPPPPPSIDPETVRRWESLAASLLNIQKLIEHIKTNTDVTLDIVRPAPTAFTEALAQDKIRLLVFSERLVPRLIGAEAALQWLTEFQNHKEKFLWTILHGEGGMGKSRIALDWLLSLEGEWAGGFLRGGFDPDRTGAFPGAKFANWQPERPTILILDYAATHSAVAAQAFERFEARKDSFPHKVRVVLLERYFSEAASYVTPLRNSNGSANSWFRGTEITKAFRVTELEMDAFVAVYVHATQELTGQPLSDSEIAEARAFFESDDFRKKRRLRPLYACLCALRRSQDREGKITDWRAEDLERYVLMHEAEIWRNEIKATDADIHMATLATIMGGLDEDTFEDRQLCDRFPTRDANLARCCRVVNHSENEQHCLAPVEPDPVGETMFQLRLKGALYEHDEGAEITARNTRKLWKWMLEQAKEGAN